MAKKKKIAPLPVLPPDQQAQPPSGGMSPGLMQAMSGAAQQPSPDQQLDMTKLVRKKKTK